MILNAFTNVFTESDGSYGPDGLWRISHPNVVFAKLRDICAQEGYSYNWLPISVSFTPDGRAVYVGSMQVFETSGSQSIIVPGIATGVKSDIDVSGVATSAFVNACLRGLGMAEFAYALPKRPSTVDTAPTRPVPPPPASPSYQSGQAAPQNPRYARATTTNGGTRSFTPRTWDGTAEVKSGFYAGKKYSQLPIEVLQKWANNADPNRNAVAELNRRQQVGGAIPSVDAGFQGQNLAPEDHYSHLTWEDVDSYPSD